MRPQAVHYLASNAAERAPRHLVVFDTETRWHDTPQGELHTLRVWCAQDVWRTPRAGRRFGHLPDHGTTADQLADFLEHAATADATTWVTAHNLGFDLAVTRLPLVLLRRGWVMTSGALTIDHPWLRLRKKSKRMTLVDSHSWLPHRLQTIGERLRIAKPALPDNDDSDEAWRARCAGDVLILAAAMGQLLDWWEANRLGAWSITGPRTGWNAMRHRGMWQRVVIDPDPEARSFERTTILAGRREAWRVGELRRDRYLEIDFERAFLTVCRDLPLPVRRTRAFDSLPLDSMYLRSDRWGAIAECTVHTATPRYPHVAGRRTLHPVGTFQTTLCGPELQAARERGDLLDVGAGWRYQLGHPVVPWARWVEGLLDGDPGVVPATAVMAAKSWSRTVPGKWATRTSREVDEIDSHLDGWWLEPGVHHPGGERCSLLHLGGRQHLILHDQEADDAFPAILAYIQSYVRDALGRLIDCFDPADMVICNTDGILVRSRRDPDLAALAERCFPFRPRIKHVWRHVEVISPQHLLLDGEPRLSGVAWNADRAGPRSWAWQSWPGLARQLELGDRPGFVRERHQVNLAHVPVARWVLQDGTTLPVSAALAPGTGATVLLTPNGQLSAAQGVLAPAQHPLLERVLRDAGVIPG